MMWGRCPGHGLDTLTSCLDVLTRRINSTATDIGMYAYINNVGCHRVRSLTGTLGLILAWAKDREGEVHEAQTTVSQSVDINGRLPPEDSDLSSGIELRSRYRL